MAGHGTDTLPSDPAVYVPLNGSTGTIGVLALKPVDLRRIFLPEQRQLLDTFVNQIVHTLERANTMKVHKAGWGWGFPSAAPSSKPMTVKSGQPTTAEAARCFNCICLFWNALPSSTRKKRADYMKATGPLLLLIEDDPQFRLLLSTTLSNQNYPVLAIATGREGLNAARTRQPSLLILDLGLPDIDGQEVIRRLRKWSELPIIVLSARNQENDITQALDNGADDYLTKPFSTAELMSRIKALLRRVAQTPGGGTQESFQVGELKIELTKRRVFVGGQEAYLTPTEFSLLSVLARNAGFVVHPPAIAQKNMGGLPI
jgi:two-component system KDP operon response regulator KdpE